MKFRALAYIATNVDEFKTNYKTGHLLRVLPFPVKTARYRYYSVALTIHVQGEVLLTL